MQIMGVHGEGNRQDMQKQYNWLKYFLAGIACMLVISVVAVAIVWLSGGFAAQDNGTALGEGEGEGEGEGTIVSGGDSPIVFGGDSTIVFEGAGFSSPENAVRAYLEGYRKIDVEEMISTFAIETFVNNYNFEAQVINNMTFSVILNSELAYPNKSRLLARDNIYQRLFQVEKNIADHVVGYTEPDFSGITEDDLAYQEEQMLIDRIIGMFPDEGAFGAISNLSVTRFLDTGEMGVDSGYNDSASKDYIDLAFVTYNIDELKDVAVSCDIGGKEYYLTFKVFRYGDKWFIGEIGETPGVSLQNAEYIINGLYKKTS